MPLSLLEWKAVPCFLGFGRKKGENRRPVQKVCIASQQGAEEEGRERRQEGGAGAQQGEREVCLH